MAVIAERVEARGNNNDSIGGCDGVYTAIAGNDGRVRLYGPGMHGTVVDGAHDAHACSLAHNPATGRIVVRVIEYRGGHILAEYDTGIAPPASASAGPSPPPRPAPMACRRIFSNCADRERHVPADVGGRPQRRKAGTIARSSSAGRRAPGRLSSVLRRIS
jgi:hypothetical protein